MNLDKVRRMASDVLKAGKGAVWFDPAQSEKIESCMTKDDVRALIAEGVIKRVKPQMKSRGRARILLAKKKKGRRRGRGKRKGTKKARQESKKRSWIKNVRSQRAMLRELRKSDGADVDKIGYRRLYLRVKGNLFKGKNYLKATVKEKKG